MRSASAGNGVAVDHRHVRDRHRSRPRDDQRQQPRAGRAADACPRKCAARASRCASARTTHPADRRRSTRPIRATTQIFVSNYALAQRHRRAAAHPRRRRRADLRRQGLLDPHLAAARPAGAARPHARATSPPRSASRTRSSPPAGSAQEPTGEPVDFTFSVTTQGRLAEPEQFEQIILRTTPDGAIVRLKDVARVELGSRDYDFVGQAQRQADGADRHLPAAGRERARGRRRRRGAAGGARQVGFPPGFDYSVPVRHDQVRHASRSRKC